VTLRTIDWGKADHEFIRRRNPCGDHARWKRARPAVPGGQDAAPGPLRGEADAYDVRVRERSRGGLRRAAEAHGKHEERTGEEDPDWPDWYALYMVRERAGEELPT
jgi:hypothetical protein